VVNRCAKTGFSHGFRPDFVLKPTKKSADKGKKCNVAVQKTYPGLMVLKGADGLCEKKENVRVLV
jgi:hypothetical protein